MSDDLALAAQFGQLSISGEQLRSYFRDRVRRYGVGAALAEARVRYEAQVLGKVLPLPTSEALA